MSKEREQKRAANLAAQLAVVPESSKFDMADLPTTHHNVEDFPILSLAIYLNKRGVVVTNRGGRTVDLIRSNFTIFRGYDQDRDDLWGRNLINTSNLHAAGFDFNAYEAANPEHKAKVGAALAAVVAYKNREK